MTLGAKIKEARRKCGLSQEQLAEKMAVSRSAVAKWETDKGLPDVGNLKILARLLNVSVDQLLDESKSTDATVIRESYQLAAYGYGCKKMMKDRVVRAKFPDATIYTLFGRPELEQLDPHPATMQDCRTLPQNLANPTDKTFYLVENGDNRLFVTVTDRFIEIRPLEHAPEGNPFMLDGWSFIKSNYEIQES